MLGLAIKQKPDEPILTLISIELSMFMRWMEDNCGRMLKWPEAEDISKRILERESFMFGKEEIVQITSRAFTSDIQRTNEFRQKTQFDDQIGGFCQSLGISKP